MARPEAVRTRRPSLRGQLLLPILLSVLGLTVTVVGWLAVREDIRTQVSAGMTGLAEESLGTLQRRVDQHIVALNDLAKYWQLHGVLPSPLWRYDTRMLLDQFPGVAWIAWIAAPGDSFRYVAQDTAWTFTPDIAEQAMARMEQPGREFTPSPDSQVAMYAFIPIRMPQQVSVGALMAAIRSDSLFGGSAFVTARRLAYVVRDEDGQEVFRQGTPAPEVPAWMRARGTIALATGGSWTVEYRPTAEYLHMTETTWPFYVLFTGILLSLGIGAITFQVLRARAFSRALSESKQLLDEQLDELVVRDRELRRLNEELEARVEERTEELQDAMVELEAFSQSISHDLRSPVGAMLNYATIVEEDYADRLDEDGQRVVARLKKSGEAAIGLLDELVQLARAGRAKPHREIVDMNTALRRAFSEALNGTENGSKVQFEMSEMPPALADAALVERIFTNLFSNSLKYTSEREERRITVSAMRGSKMNSYDVSDNGVGFDPSVASSIFEPFRRHHAPSRFPGTGLGLAIVARIVRRLGGQATAESDGQSGAMFRITLPAAEESS